jgi:hypothetical protein
MRGHNEVVKVLLSHGAMADIQDKVREEKRRDLLPHTYPTIPYPNQDRIYIIMHIVSAIHTLDCIHQRLL